MVSEKSRVQILEKKIILDTNLLRVTRRSSVRHFETIQLNTDKILQTPPLQIKHRIAKILFAFKMHFKIMIIIKFL